MLIDRVKWTRPDGERRTSVVSFDRSSAEERMQVADGFADVEIVQVDPGE